VRKSIQDNKYGKSTLTVKRVFDLASLQSVRPTNQLGTVRFDCGPSNDRRTSQDATDRRTTLFLVILLEFLLYV